MTLKSLPFSAGQLVRDAAARSSADEIWNDGKAKCLALLDGLVLVSEDDQLCLLDVGDHKELLREESKILLGRDDQGRAVFAAEAKADEPDADRESYSFLDEERRLASFPNASFKDLRGIMTLLSPLEAEIAATGRGLNAWHSRHGFCANCGAQTESELGGWQRHCASCETKHFPRTDPVAIMLVTRGNKCLLGRGPQWPEGMYSALAGFVEPGETPEAAVRREVFEEVGVHTGAVRYAMSQPWPFPSSLMLGFYAEALTVDLNIDENEIQDALWLTREELMEVYAGQHPVVSKPRTGSIAEALISNWLAGKDA